MAKLYMFVILVLSYYLMRAITGVHLTQVLADLGKFYSRGMAGASQEYAEKTQQDFKRMSLDKKHKSKKYKFYCSVNEILAALKLKERGVSVEGFCSGLAVLCMLLAFVITVLTSKLWIFFVFTPLFFVVSLAMVFLGSRVKVQRRKQLLLDSMDILCAVMTDGFLKAVKDNIKQFPSEVRVYFENFLKNVELLSISVPRAVNILNEEVGSLYDEFCDSVITYERDRAQGMEQLFEFYISENAKTLARDREIKRISDAENMDFLATVICIVLFGFVSSSMLGAAAFWSSALGIVVISLLAVFGVGVFIYIQYLLSKEFIYTERGK